MSGWGVGLGSFMQGMSQGYGLRQRMENDQMTRKFNDIKLRSLERAEQEELRTNQLRQQRQQIGKEAGQQFRSQVAEGAAQPSKAYDWFAQNYAPKMELFFLENGDIENAARFNKWSNDAQTKKQIETMGVLIGEFQEGATTGDFTGLGEGLGKFYNALPDDVRDGSTFKGLDFVKNEQGQVTAITATFKNRKGKDVVHTWNDIASFQQALEAWANPAALYQSVVAGREQAKKYKADLREYAEKKGIDVKAALAQKQGERELGLGGKSPTERYRMAQDTLAKISLNGKPPTDAEVREYLRMQDQYEQERSPGIGMQPTAQPQQPERIIVDTKTGQPVEAPKVEGGAPAPQQAIEPPVDPRSITSPEPGSAPAPQAATDGSAPAVQQAPAVTAPRMPQRAPGIGVQTEPRRVQMPQSGARPAPQQQGPNRDVTGDVGNAVKRAGEAVGGAAAGAARYLGEAIASTNEAKAVGLGLRKLNEAVPQVGNSRIERINAGRRSAGLEPLEPEQQMEIAAEGMVEPGNIDLDNRPVLNNGPRSISTIQSITITIDGGRGVLIPTIVNGRRVSEEEAIQHFERTGEHLGIFRSEEEASAYGKALSAQMGKKHGRQR